VRSESTGVAAVPVAGSILLVGAPFAAAAGAVPAPWRNCTQVNKRYPHGVGRLDARDRTSGEPVTSFKRSNRLYRLAMSYNSGLDRDKDRIACEKP
jgi:Excalibur calcium-binding domain